MKYLMFGETTIFHVKIRSDPIETTIHKWMFQVLVAISCIINRYIYIYVYIYIFIWGEASHPTPAGHLSCYPISQWPTLTGGHSPLAKDLIPKLAEGKTDHVDDPLLAI